MSFFRRSKKVPKEEAPPPLRTSPSLPELSSQGIPWPEDLVDIAAIRATPPPPPATQQGAAKTSLNSPEPIPWHKPFRTLSTTSDKPDSSLPASAANGMTTISALYMSAQPAHFEGRARRATDSPAPTARPSIHRRPRAAPPQFNIMVAGGQGTGKTSLLRLLLDTADISPGASADQRSALERFLRGAPRRTQEIHSVTVEIAESRFERVLLSVTDTPGLDLRLGRELTLERQVSGLVRRLDDAFADTMSEESKVVRQSKGDRHIHLVIYVLDPASLMTAAARREAAALPTKTRSDTTVSAAKRADVTDGRENDTPSLTDDTDTDTDSEDEDERLTLAPAELRVLRRLAERANVLPVIGRADSLTDTRLRAVKDAVRRELLAARLDLGVFGPTAADVSMRSDADVSTDGHTNGNGNGHAADESALDDADDDDDATERRARPVIKLRTGRRQSSATRSRSRVGLASEARDDHEPTLPDPTDMEAVANVRFGAAMLAQADLSALLPFALVAPEHTRRHRRARPAPWDRDEESVSADHSETLSPVSPGARERTASYGQMYARPEDLRGLFTRAYRWGMIDVLEPQHCDFAALRTAILSTHMKVLKTHTREVLYERFRTEKLLVRRATRKFGEKEAQQLVESASARTARLTLPLIHPTCHRRFAGVRGDCVRRAPCSLACLLKVKVLMFVIVLKSDIALLRIAYP
ncbi:hypothetical protein K488DRAFT_41108 [Vararia minispora EC-137]|uniref:Uncharacterized protein n=1 Tax=Vararia minispora EC-137 TaxID=1314806 RepID=A0ACB8QY40_9AGAM|nr:hypothetical protein K488DRAFT_41108 [Vararia minispora EC-137]